MSDKRFDVNFSLTITEDQEDGSSKPFFDNTLVYHDLPYDGMVAVEGVLIEALGKLNELGFLEAEQKGCNPERLGMVRQMMGK